MSVDQVLDGLVQRGGISMSSRSSRVCRVGVAGLLTAGVVWVASGFAVADPVADKTRTVDNDTGWQLSVTKTRETLDRYPNLAATMFTREGFVAVKATAEVTGTGRQPVIAGAIALGYQIGCQVDVSNGLTLGMGFSVGPNASVTISQFPAVTLGASASVTPNISTTVKPGGITTIELGTKPLAGARASIAVDQVQIKVDACMGPVSLRSFATARISTPEADDTVSVYGDPIYL
ncbi:membrane protein [Nocardia vulneris]|uniref:Membrane protein n=2 Tax=Nocardia vulneris TaxID=1141657 RepID=A0ABR4Z707_9NOCA|nr:membrane protein [Nocardia vulneris]